MKSNIKYLLIVIAVAGIVGFWAVDYANQIERDISDLRFSEINISR